MNSPVGLVELHAERLDQTLAMIQRHRRKKVLLELNEGHQLLGIVVRLHIDARHQMLIDAHPLHLVRRQVHVIGGYLRYDAQPLGTVRGTGRRRCRRLGMDHGGMSLQIH